MMKKHLNAHRMIAVTAIVIFVCLNILIFSKHTKTMDVKIETSKGDLMIKAEIAQTPAEKRKGLMRREKLNVGEGMIFVYSKPVLPGFWMKNTLIPLDFIFIGEDFVIKHIEQKIAPCPQDEECPMHYPPEPVKYVLETVGGYCKLFGVKKGDSVKLIL